MKRLQSLLIKKYLKLLKHNNKDKLNELAEVLLDKEVIFKDNLEKIFGKRPFDKGEEVEVNDTSVTES